MRRFAPIAAVAVLSLPAVSAAAEARPVAEKRVTPIANTTLSKSKDGRVCKLVLRTGSRLGEQKICKTKEEWDVITQDARQATERRQIFMTNDPSGG
jgi:hypothetical protein